MYVSLSGLGRQRVTPDMIDGMGPSFAPSSSVRFDNVLPVQTAVNPTPRPVTPATPARAPAAKPKRPNIQAGWIRLAAARNAAFWNILPGVPASHRAAVSKAYQDSGATPDLKANPITTLDGWKQLAEIRGKGFWSAWHKLPQESRGQARTIYEVLGGNTPAAKLAELSQSAWQQMFDYGRTKKLPPASGAPAGGGGGGGGGSAAANPVQGWIRLAAAHNAAFWRAVQTGGLPVETRRQLEQRYRDAGGTPDLKANPIKTVEGWKRLADIRARAFEMAAAALPSTLQKPYQAKARAIHKAMGGRMSADQLARLSPQQWQAQFDAGRAMKIIG